MRKCTGTDKIKSKGQANAWIAAAAVNLVIAIAIFACTDLMYETNDDQGIAERIANGYPYISFVNYFLCRILIALQSIIPGANALVLFQIFMSFASFTVIMGLLLEGDRPAVFRLAGIAVISIFCIDHYQYIQFTKTSAVMLVAGSMLLMDAFVQRRSTARFLIAFVFIFLGSWLRFMNTLVVIAFAGVFLIAWVAANRHSITRERYFTDRQIAVYAAVIVLTAGVFASDHATKAINSGSDELRAYNEYDSYRAVVTDYAAKADYENRKSEYTKLGISENDLELVQNWYLDYDGAAGIDKLRGIAHIYSLSDSDNGSMKDAVKSFVKNVMIDVKTLNRTGVHILLLLAAALMGLLLMRPRYSVYVIAVGILSAGLYVYLFYTGRALYRGTYVIDITAMMWLLYYIRPEFMRGEGPKIRMLLNIMCVIMIAVTLAGHVTIQGSLAKQYETKCERHISTELIDYIGENRSCFFVLGDGTRGYDDRFFEPLKYPLDARTANCSQAGGWGTMSPYTLGRLKQYGLDNMFSDLIDNDNARIVSTERMRSLETYLNKWYGNGRHIEFVRTDRILNYNIYKVVAE